MTRENKTDIYHSHPIPLERFISCMDSYTFCKSFELSHSQLDEFKPNTNHPSVQAITEKNRSNAYRGQILASPLFLYEITRHVNHLTPIRPHSLASSS